MDWNVEEAAGWLQDHVDQTVSVIKDEQGDIDQVSLTIKDVALTASVEENQDDYMPLQILVLYGEGMIMGEESAAPLPDAEYEIPVGGSWTCSATNDGLSIVTGRAAYTISLLH